MMDALAKAEMAHDRPRQIEAIGVREAALVAVCRPVDEQHARPRRQLLPCIATGSSCSGPASAPAHRIAATPRRRPAGPRVGGQTLSLVRIGRQVKQRVGDQVRRRLVPGDVEENADLRELVERRDS